MCVYGTGNVLYTKQRDSQPSNPDSPTLAWLVVVFSLVCQLFCIVDLSFYLVVDEYKFRPSFSRCRSAFMLFGMHSCADR